MSKIEVGSRLLIAVNQDSTTKAASIFHCLMGIFLISKNQKDPTIFSNSLPSQYLEPVSSDEFFHHSPASQPTVVPWTLSSLDTTLLPLKSQF